MVLARHKDSQFWGDSVIGSEFRELRGRAPGLYVHERQVDIPGREHVSFGERGRDVWR